MRSFAILNSEIKNRLKELGFKRPTEIQEVAIPKILEGKNALLIAPTGIGKTEAAVLPIFDLFLRERPEGVSILYITPLRALNRDLLDRLKWWAGELKINIAVRHGDTSQYLRRKQALAPPDMLITTPETLQAILLGRVMKKHLKNVRWVIVDEIHELAEDKRGAQLSLGLERLRELTRIEFQRIGLSATIGSPHKVSRFLVNDREVEILSMQVAKEMELKVEKPRPKKKDKSIAEKIFSSLSASSRISRMEELIKTHASTLIFVNTRQMAEILASRFRILGDNVGIHHSSLSQEVRIGNEEGFKSGKLKALICTSSMELGIDIGSVDLVIQYMSPRQVTRLLQRIGRSGHKIGGKSKGIIITTDQDDILESLVITRKAIKEELEEVKINEKPYDVLAHQLVGLALDFGRVKSDEAFAIVKRSFVFSSLKKEEFEETLSLLGNLRLIWKEGDRYGKSRNSWKYYYENLSTIPDQRRYLVRNTVTQTPVGTLDEAFVVGNIDLETLIIFKGSPWRILAIEEKEILVEPTEDITGAIPSWVGEEIPVPYEVAREVGEIRRRKSISKYKCDPYTEKLGLSKIRRHERKGIPVPDDRYILIELFENFAVIHSCFGMKVNQTLGRVFSILLSSRLGHSVRLQVDAYRIILQSHKRFSKSVIKDLFDIEFELIEPLLSRSLKRTSLFKWKFMHVAKRFGAISREATYNTLNLKKIIEIYEDSLIYKETLKEIFNDNLDLGNTKKVIDGIRKGTIKTEILKLKEPSPIAEMGLESYGEIIIPERAERMILKALKKRILERRVKLFCTYCVGWSESYRVKNIPKDIKCSKCSARMLAIIKSNGRDTISTYRRYKRKGSLNADEKAEVKRIRTTANLYLSYGKDAIVALAARGIGPETAKRVLLASRSKEELYKNILKAERNYTRTKRFWD